MLSKVKFIEDELNTEYYDILREEESKEAMKDDLPSVVPEFQRHPKIDEEFEQKRKEDEERIESIKRNASERQRELAALDEGIDSSMNHMNERHEEWRR